MNLIPATPGSGVPCAAFCYNSGLIKNLKTSYIQIISAFPEALGIIVEGGKILAIKPTPPCIFGYIYLNPNR
jgi:hypothetical protein